MAVSTITWVIFPSVEGESLQKYQRAKRDTRLTAIGFSEFIREWIFAGVCDRITDLVNDKITKSEW